MITFNTLYATNPPLFRNSFLSPRTRNSITDGLKEETIFSGDVNYVLRSPVVKARLTAFYTKFMNQTEVTTFYLDDANTLVNYAMTNINKENYGIEFGSEITLFTGFTVNATASLGQYLLVSNPDVTITEDDNAKVLSNEQVWVKYFRQSGVPQTAFALGAEYNSPSYWWIGLTGSYYDNIYLDYNPVSRTKNEQGFYPYWKPQIKENPAFLLDAFVGKSWRINDLFINISANVSNILNNTSVVTGGYEQYRFDTSNTSLFDPKIYYYNGFNYFINFSIRM